MSERCSVFLLRDSPYRCPGAPVVTGHNGLAYCEKHDPKFRVVTTDKRVQCGMYLGHVFMVGGRARWQVWLDKSVPTEHFEEATFADAECAMLKRIQEVARGGQ